MKKKLLLALITVLAIGMLTACGSGDSGSSGDSGDEGAATGSWATVEETGVLTVGTEGNYSPYSYHGDNDELTGYDVEVVEAIGDYLGIDIEWTESNWDGLIAGLDAEKYDVVADQITITEERLEKYLFSNPYTYVYGVVITRDDYNDIASFEDLDGKDVALTTTSNWAQLSESYGATIVGTNGFSDSIQLVLEERADATVNDNVTFLDYIAQKPDAAVKIAAASDEINESAFLIRQGDEELQAKINEALEALESDGTISAISEKYFGEDISTK